MWSRTCGYLFAHLTLALRRYEGAADEGGVNLEICGTVTFHLKLTTAAALEKAEELSALSAAADVFASGDSFGAEELKDGKPYPYTVMVEQPSVMLKVLRDDYLGEIHPLQYKEKQRKVDFLSPMMPFATWKQERIQHVCDWLQVKLKIACSCCKRLVVWLQFGKPLLPFASQTSGARLWSLAAEL